MSGSRARAVLATGALCSVVLVGCGSSTPSSSSPTSSTAPSATVGAPSSATSSTASGNLDVMVGPQQLPGTLRLPSGQAKPVAVLLLPGSGPSDRDETIGAAGNRPLRDIADGLAAQGIASLRFDKRTKAAPTSFTKTSTIADEYLDDAAAAIKMLGERPETSKDKVFVVGHSQGGMLMPTILKANPTVAGGVSLAGSPRSLFDIMYDQNVALLAQSTMTEADKKATLTQVRSIMDQAKAVRKPTDTVPAQLASSMPAAYVASLNALTPVADAKGLSVPMLFLQGEKDVQVSPTADFGAWQKGLAGRAKTEFKTYPGLNHLFMKSSGKPAPADYDAANTVDPTVIADLAAWLVKEQ